MTFLNYEKGTYRAAVYISVQTQTLAHADIFFLVTTIAVVLVTVGILILIYFAVRALRKAEGAAEDLRGSALYRLLFGKKRKH